MGDFADDARNEEDRQLAEDQLEDAIQDDPEKLTDREIAIYLDKMWGNEQHVGQDWIDESLYRGLIAPADDDAFKWDGDPSIEWFEFSAKGMEALQ